VTTTTRSHAAREAMLEAAELIVVERGLGSLTLSGVQQRAGQANKSAAAYHFGDRVGLLSALAARHLGPVGQRREDLLAAAGPEATVEQLVEALVRPLAEATVLRPGSRWARVLAQLFLDPLAGPMVLAHAEAASFRDTQRRLATHLGGQSPFTDGRIAATVGLLISTLALWEGQLDRLEDPTLLADDLVGLCLSTLRTPAPHRGEHP